MACVALAGPGCGLTPQRELAPLPPPVPQTLTQVDGRRMPSVNDQSMPVDLNIIPGLPGRMDVTSEDTFATQGIAAIMPQGHYLIVLEFDVGLPAERRIQANFEVSGNQIRCVNSTDRQFIGLAGVLQPQVGGRIVVTLRKDNHVKTQVWERAGEGRWRVLESPDRGETQMAIPVEDGRLE